MSFFIFMEFGEHTQSVLAMVRWILICKRHVTLVFGTNTPCQPLATSMTVVCHRVCVRH